MSAVTISFGLQKGGVSKTTTSTLSAFILARQGYRVLVCDMDSQGNASQFLTNKSPYDFQGRTILEACKERNPEPYIVGITENLDLLPAEDLLSTFSRWLFDEYKPELQRTGQVDPNALLLVLKQTLDAVREKYDFIILDLPPNLGEQTLNGMAASDYCVVMAQSEPFAYDALQRYLETLEHVQSRVNPNTKLAGILTTLLDARTALGNFIRDRIAEEYEDLVFSTVIRRKSRVVEFSFEGISDKTKADREALDMYESFVKELTKRVNKG
ncbi:ParA family protein [Alicyclobacillus fastidiosus]|uniref:ParA family protein n=1 Tax=Alicyclobacillus fastidiosus TaxID=392011 RepID=UPI0023E97C83|nr:ParA family protein [Alicyclobacillus fastidiosus]GMA65967.1 sporulation initiation inhibitor Soj [Alicyclobacillus fastidiosus]GMA66187.1 sporulation initiation inhibitor Soj [Alicyclobacillus fastidiosus]